MSKLSAQICDAARAGDAAAVKSLLQEGQVNDTTEGGKTLLHIAVQNKHASVVRVLKEKDADIWANDESGKSAFDYIYDMIAPVETAIEQAIEQGSDITELAKEYSTLLEIRRYVNGNLEPLTMFVAVGDNDIHTVGGCTEADVKEKYAGEDNQTLLHKAASSGHAYLIQVLINKGADINAVDKYGNTPLQKAVSNRSEKAIKALLKAGANPGLANKEGKTPLYEVALWGDDALPYAQMLVDAGASVKGAGENLPSPLHASAMQGEKSMSAFLIEKGADVNARNEDGKTPLLLALMSSAFEMASVLIEKGADTKIPDNNGMTCHTMANFTLASFKQELVELQTKQPTFLCSAEEIEERKEVVGKLLAKLEALVAKHNFA